MTKFDRLFESIMDESARDIKIGDVVTIAYGNPKEILDIIKKELNKRIHTKAKITNIDRDKISIEAINDDGLFNRGKDYMTGVTSKIMIVNK